MKVRRSKVRRRKSDRNVLPLERHRWSCVDQHGCISVSVFLTDYGGHQTNLSVWDPDDTGYERWTRYRTRSEAEAAYKRLVDVVTNAPNPLPFAWLLIHGLTQ